MTSLTGLKVHITSHLFLWVLCANHSLLLNGIVDGDLQIREHSDEEGEEDDQNDPFDQIMYLSAGTGTNHCARSLDVLHLLLLLRCFPF